MSTPEGWYDDGSSQLRWWDGARWTDHTAPLAATAVPTAEPDVSDRTRVRGAFSADPLSAMDSTVVGSESVAAPSAAVAPAAAPYVAAPYVSPQRAVGTPPSAWPTGLVTFFFGIFGLIPAMRHSDQARSMGYPTQKYWIAFGCAIAGSILFWILFYVVFLVALFSAATPDYYG